MSAFLKENTSEFNKRYSLQAVSPPSSRSSSPLPSRPSSPLGLSKRSNSQYELAKLALESHSPKNFNVRYGVTKRRKTRKHRKSRRSQSRRR